MFILDWVAAHPRATAAFIAALFIFKKTAWWALSLLWFLVCAAIIVVRDGELRRKRLRARVLLRKVRLSRALSLEEYAELERFRTDGTLVPRTLSRADRIMSVLLWRFGRSLPRKLTDSRYVAVPDEDSLSRGHWVPELALAKRER